MSRSSDRSLVEAILRATGALAHRGPDGEAFWTDVGGLRGRVEVDDDARIVLGHRRLSIVDLAGGGQPLANEDETIWLAFNGEIYNQLELRAELESRGHRFRTSADTEVIVHGWEEWGTRLFGRLNGIFAFALADRTRQQVVVVRDPMGVKPLYVGTRDGATWWSSELAAATEAGLTSGRLSHDALKLFFTFRFIPSPHTIFEGTAKLPPGHYAILRTTDVGDPPVFVPYASDIRSSASPATSAEWQEALIGELDAAVKRQLMADVPVASLLSGGVDSSLITQMMTRHLPYVPRTFGIGFSDASGDGEAAAARRAAEELGVLHDTTLVDEGEYVAAWPDAIAHVGEPIANAGGLLIDLICRRVGQSHKVVLTGQGADEPLGGYTRHLVERLHTVARAAPRASAFVTGALVGADSADRLRRAFAARDRVERYVQIFSVLPAEEVDALVPGGAVPARELARTAVARWLPEDEGRDSLNELLRVDVRMSLADDLLLIADHFSMRSSVELRVPFLDLQLVELLERMPSSYKVSHLGKRKWLYRKSAAAHLPPVTARRLCGFRARLARKRGFQAPLNAWFESAGSLGTRAWLEPLAGVPGLSPEVAGRIAGQPDDGNHARRTTALFSLSTWLRAAEAHRGTAPREPVAVGRR